MSTHANLAKYRELLRKEADAKKQELDVKKLQLDLEVELRALEKELELDALRANTAQSAVEHEDREFRRKYAHELNQADHDFIAMHYRNPREVREHTELSDSKLKRAANAGKIAFKRNDAGHRMYRTTSVMEFLLNAKAKKKR